MSNRPTTHEELFDISAIVCTYNRSDILKESLTRIAAQQADDLRYEVIVVDNNSTDDTRRVIEAFIAESPCAMRYVFEGRQGVSHARNAGIAAARGFLLAFFDDDVLVTSNWLKQIKQVFDCHGDVDYVGGKVLPRWQSPPPAWLNRDNWAPIAVQDYGDEPFRLDEAPSVGLISANLAIRRSVLNEVGGFLPELQRVKNGIGSMEDHELLERLARAGKCGLYAPQLVVWADVPEARMTRNYHRRWHRGHGKFYAVRRSAAYEQTRKGRLFDVPAHLYRQAALDAAAWLNHFVRGQAAQAFARESRLWFFLGFIKQRWRQPSARGNSETEKADAGISLRDRRRFARNAK